MTAYFVRSGAGGSADGSNWTNAYTTLTTAISGKAAGDRFWVADDHNESTASTITLTFPGTAAARTEILCADHTVSSPTTADLKIQSSAGVSSSGASNIVLNGVFYVYGVYFKAGVGSVGVIRTGQSGTSCSIMDQCTIEQVGSATTTIYGSTNGSRTRLIDCTLKYANANSVTETNGDFAMVGGSISGTAPTTFLTTAGCGIAIFEGTDLSLLSGKTLVGDADMATKIFVMDCKLPASFTPSAVVSRQGGPETRIFRSDSSGTDYRIEKYNGRGVMTTSIVLYRASAANDGERGYSYKLASGANCDWVLSFSAEPIQFAITATGSPITATVEGIANAASVNNDDVWLEVGYFGSNSNPQRSRINSTKANLLASGTSATASTQAWDSGISSRANTTAYALGDQIKLASNSGRVFFCTTAGTSAGSEPGGYASAVDGGSVTDGSAVFRAGVRIKMAVTFTPQMKGYAMATVKVGKASTNFWIDPKVTQS